MTPDDRAGYQVTLLQSGGSEKTTEQTPVGGVRILTEVERAWLAGVIDGEGSIFISKIAPKNQRHYRRGFYYRPQLSVANSDPAFLERVREIIGKGYVGLDKQKNQDPTWKDKWQYKGSGLVLRGILPQILSHLIIKREIAEAMLCYLEFMDKNPIDGPMRPPPGYDEELDSLYMLMKQLNAKGRIASTVGSESLAPWSPKHRGRGGRAMECRLLTEPEKAWLAGIIDGEGSIFLSKVINPKTRRGFFYLPTIGVSNTNRAILLKVAETIGEGTVCFARKGDARTRPRWMYIATSGVPRAILPQILPYLIVKRDRALLMLQYLEFIDNNPIYGRGDVPSGYYEKLDALHLAMKRLNQKGKGAGIL